MLLINKYTIRFNIRISRYAACLVLASMTLSGQAAATDAAAGDDTNQPRVSVDADASVAQPATENERAAENTDARAEVKTVSRPGDAYQYPHWPKRQYQQREMVPPPPPGPYMSTALSDYSVKGPAFSRYQSARDDDRDAARRMPGIEMYSPDREWPELRPGNDWRPKNHWEPKDGYHFPPLAPAKKFVPPVRKPDVSGPYSTTGNSMYPGSGWKPGMSFGSGSTNYRPYSGPYVRPYAPPQAPAVNR
jgi:hypothetical protein